MTMGSETNGREFDVIVLGGALSGGATAFLLLRDRPSLRILILEKSTVFSRRVGEATIEVSTYFLCRQLGLARHLCESHFPKNGLRFWFAGQGAERLDQCGEIGGRYLSRVPAFLVDRAVMDEEVLQRACAAGATLWRPAVVQKVELAAGGRQLVQVKYQDRTETVSARWVVDASGVAALLARQNGWWRSNTAHPTTAVWSRWKGVKDWDGLELARKYPCWASACYGMRGTATNHLMGDGWWAWLIALKGGDVSVGVVYDQRVVKFPTEGSLGQRLKDFLLAHPAGREVLADAQWTEGDVHWRKNLAYYSTVFAGDGFSLVGDAAGFLDPFYSPGLDWVSFTVSATVNLIVAQQQGEVMEKRLQCHNADFAHSYSRWFESIYQDKYHYMGDFELMRLAFLLDLTLYYQGVANQPFMRGGVALREPYFSTPPSVPVFWFMRLYNRRFAQIARLRRNRGTLGRRNGERFLFGGFNFDRSGMKYVLKATASWAWLELTEGWRTWFQTGPESAREPAPAAAPAEAARF
jgi:flavin-dependent dehydrogenase